MATSARGGHSFPSAHPTISRLDPFLVSAGPDSFCKIVCRSLPPSPCTHRDQRWSVNDMHLSQRVLNVCDIKAHVFHIPIR